MVRFRLQSDETQKRLSKSEEAADAAGDLDVDPADVCAQRESVACIGFLSFLDSCSDLLINSRFFVSRVAVAVRFPCSFRLLTFPHRSPATLLKKIRAATQVERCFRGHNARVVFRLKKKLYLDALMNRGEHCGVSFRPTLFGIAVGILAAFGPDLAFLF